MQEKIQYCLDTLPRVSRTFAPTIRMLPKGLEVPVTVAYLLCRIADTVEDTDALSVSEKKDILTVYANIFTSTDTQYFNQFNELIINLPNATPDDELTHNFKIVYSVFESFSPLTKTQIGRWVAEMSRGMHKYAQSKFRKKFTFLNTMKELDEYTYFVAGTVGYLLTELFSFYSKKITPALNGRLESLAESFGKGLQLVNIIRDMATDLRRGQSYIPDELLQKYRLTRESIFEQENAERAQYLFNELIENAVKHLDHALDYILLIPKRETRIRLFCMLPLFWAMRTLQKIQENTLALLGSDKVKIPRNIIRKEYYLALINMNSNRLMRRHYQNIRRELNNMLLPSGV
ncbi:MAG: squalene/phytoene synthase family protein [Calditrichaceae bacterium]